MKKYQYILRYFRQIKFIHNRLLKEVGIDCPITVEDIPDIDMKHIMIHINANDFDQKFIDFYDKYELYFLDKDLLLEYNIWKEFDDTNHIISITDLHKLDIWNKSFVNICFAVDGNFMNKETKSLKFDKRKLYVLQAKFNKLDDDGIKYFNEHMNIDFVPVI